MRSRALIAVWAGCALLSCSPAAPEFTPELRADLQARAFAIACEELNCTSGPVYSWDTVPEDVRAAIAEMLEAEVTYLDSEGFVDLADGGSSYRDGGTAIAVYATRLLKDDVVGVDVYTGHGPFDVLGRTVLFQWNGTEWSEATPDEVGVTVTTAVS